MDYYVKSKEKKINRSKSKSKRVRTSAHENRRERSKANRQTARGFVRFTILH